MIDLSDTLERLESHHQSAARAVLFFGGPMGTALDDPEIMYHMEASAACFVKRLNLYR